MTVTIAPNPCYPAVVNFDWQRIGEAAQLGATLLAALGTPIIAWLVYSLNKSNSAFARAEAARNRTVELNKIKLSLLERRVEFIKKIEKIFDEYRKSKFRKVNAVNAGRVFNDGIYNLKSISKALFNPDICRMLDCISTPVNQSVAIDQLLRDSINPISDKDKERYLDKLELALTNFAEITHDLFTSLYDQTRLDVFDDLG